MPNTETFKVYYKCDPELNEPCNKKNCHLIGGPCTETSNIQYAKKPIEKVRMMFPSEPFDPYKNEWDEHPSDFIDEEPEDE